MSYCPNCRVELAPDAEFCPLCLGRSEVAPETANQPLVSKPGVERNAEEATKLSRDEKRRVAMELLTVSIVMALTVSLATDVLFSHGFSWSRYVGLILAMVWLFSFMPLALWGHPWYVCAILAPALPLGLFLWGLFYGSHTWFFPVGLPIALCLEIAVIGSILFLRLQPRWGLNVPGVLLAASGFLCCGIDAIVLSFRNGSYGLSWSVVVVVSVIPVAGLFFYLHYRILKQASLKKLFRL